MQAITHLYPLTYYAKISEVAATHRLPNRLKPIQGYRTKSYPNNGAAPPKENSKNSSAFPSMEDQLKDLLKGNSEESLIAPGHNSTRFHLDYTATGESLLHED